MNFRPLHDRVVVRRVEEDETTTGGIIIPDTAKEKPVQGEILAVGPGARNENGEVVPLDVKIGDRRGHDRRRRAGDHERIRHHGRARDLARQEGQEGRLKPEA